MCQEYDIVRLQRTLSERLPAGTVGTVLMVYDEPDLPKSYEVEFVDAAGRTIAVLTIRAEDVIGV